jgi:hypothetical protein
MASFPRSIDSLIGPIPGILLGECCWPFGYAILSTIMVSIDQNRWPIAPMIRAIARPLHSSCIILPPVIPHTNQITLLKKLAKVGRNPGDLLSKRSHGPAVTPSSGLG